MASGSTAAPAAASRALRLSAIFSSTPRGRPRKPKPAPTPDAPAGEAGSQPPQKARVPFRKILGRLSLRQIPPEKLVSEFIAASTSSARFRDQPRVYEDFVSRLASAGHRDAVTAIIDAQKPFIEASGEAFAARLIRLYGRASMPSHAAAIFRDLPPQLKTVRTFNNLLAAYLDAGDFDALATAFQEIPASHPTIVPGVYSYNIFISSLCQNPDLSAAVDTVGLMERRGLSPDIVTFKILLNAFYSNGRMDDADKIWEMMKEKNVKPDTKCFNKRLRALVAQGRIEDAAAIVESMEKDGPKPDTVTYNELIRGYCKEGMLDEAKKVYDNFVKNECAPNKGTFQTLVPRLLDAGELDCALSCCHDIISSKCRVNRSLLPGVVNALVAASRLEEARIVELGRRKLRSFGRRGSEKEEESGNADEVPSEIKH
ncbi:hypothetical protein ACP70R_006952 [Stipagrostis hirtigluma subsp. patula]